MQLSTIKLKAYLARSSSTKDFDLIHVRPRETCETVTALLIPDCEPDPQNPIRIIARAEFCCRLGYYFFQKGDFQTAVFWYKLATQTKPPEEGMGFVNIACSTWLPHLQLCICYDRLGEYQTAYKHNEIARQYRPKDKNILHNKKYLESVFQKNGG